MCIHVRPLKLCLSITTCPQGELQVTLREARNLPVGGLPWQSNPYCRLLLGNQVVSSRRDDDTSHAGRHRAPVWNQEFHFLVEDASSQVGWDRTFVLFYLCCYGTHCVRHRFWT